MKEFFKPAVIIGGLATVAAFAFGLYCIDMGVDLLAAAAYISPILANTAVYIGVSGKEKTGKKQ